MARLYRACRTLQLDALSSSSSSSFVGQRVRLKVVAGKPSSGKVAVVVAKGFVYESMVTEKEKASGVDLLASPATEFASSTLKIFKPVTKGRSWTWQPQMFIETAIINCRFFTLIGTLGTLIGSILCFVEGCFHIIELFLEYFHGISKRSEQGEMLHILIEAMDMFFIGTSMLIFGMGLYVLFINSRQMKGSSHLFGMFQLKRLPIWLEMESVAQAKSKIGHAVVMILQVGLLDKFKTVAVTSGLDLACFAGAILVSSASIFLLSKLSNKEIVEAI